VADISVIVGEFPCLGGNRLGDLTAAIAHVHAIEAGEGIEQPRAVAIGDVDALAAGDDPVSQFAAGELTEMGRGMEEMGAVPFGEQVVAQHRRTPR